MSQGLLAVDGLTVKYGGVRALDRVCLDVPAGSFVGLIGANGAGKTTFIDAVTGLTPMQGNVTFDGRDVSQESPSRRARSGLGRTFQSLELFEDLTVRENLLVTAEHARWYSPVLELLRPIRQQDAVEAVDAALTLLGIEGLSAELPPNLSLGHRKLVTVARALSARPKLLLLDEPAAGLDSDESLALGEKLRQVANEGTAMLLVDHDVGLVLGVCDQIHVLEFGRLIASGPPRDIATNELVIRSYLGADPDEVLPTIEATP